MAALFQSDTFELVDGDRIVRREDVPQPTSAELHNEENDAIIRELSRYVQSCLILDYDFEAVPLSDRDGLEATSTFMATKVTPFIYLSIYLSIYPSIYLTHTSTIGLGDSREGYDHRSQRCR
jgi:hypothetical protein